MMQLVAVPKILFNSLKVSDNVLSEASAGVTADYGYGAAFVANASQPFIAGWFYQNPPGTAQPFGNGNSALVGLGDATSLDVGATRSYGFFAIPFGVSGSFSPANLQAEAESGTLGTGWTSQAGAGGNSNALEAKCASGTVAANADTFGTAFIPPTGGYDIWFRVKVTTNVGSALEMTLGVWNNDTSAFVAAGSTTFNRTAMTTSYAWYRAANNVTLTVNNMRFRAVTALTLGTDWMVDEAVMIPTGLGGGNGAPSQIWAQFMYDRSVRLVNP